MKTKNIIAVMLIAVILASCAPVAKVIPTETAIPTSTFTPIPPTIEPSPTAELPLEQKPETIQAAELLASVISQAGTSITYEQILQQGLTVVQKESFDPTDTAGMRKIKYEIAYTQDDFPLMIKMEGKNWKSANFDNNPYNIVFGYTERIRPQLPAISNKPLGALFATEEKYTSNQFVPISNIANWKDGYDGTSKDQPSFFTDGVLDEKALQAFIKTANTSYRGLQFTGNGIKETPKGNPNMYVMVVSGQGDKEGDKFNLAFNKMDSVTTEEAFVWYITNTTRAAIKNNVNIFAVNELIQKDNYWLVAIPNKTSEQLIEIAIQTVRLAAGDKKVKFMINDDFIERPGTRGDIARTKIFNIISDFDKSGVIKSSELIIGIHYHNLATYQINNLNSIFEKLYKAGIRDIRLTEVDIIGKQKPNDEQILTYYKDLIKAVKEQKKLHPDLNISVVFFDEYWENDWIGKSMRITDIPNGLHQLIAELYK
jgi:hypothetical protein